MAAKTPQKRVLFAYCPKLLGASLVSICFAVLAIAFAAFSPAIRTYAATSPTINFQARLMSSNGAVAADGSYSVVFKIYSTSSGGSALWTETQTLSATNGYLTANLGSATAFNSSIPWGSPIWLTMNVNGDGEMSPRLSITSVPSALALTSGNGGTNVSTLTFAAPTASEQIILPAESGSTVTVCYQNDTACGFAASSGSGSYIDNQTSLQAGANFNISGTGIAATALQAPSFDTASAGALTVGGTNATSVSIGNSTAATTVSIQGGTSASAIGLTAAAGGSINITTSGAGKVNVTSATGIVEKITTSQVTAFQVQNNSGTALLNVDTSNSRVGVNNSAPSYALDVTGDINTSTMLRVGGTDVCDTAGTTGCIAKSGSGYYIHNQTTLQSGANLYIQGGVSTVTAILEANGADVLDLQNSSAAPVVTFSNTGATLIKPSTGSTTAFQVQNASATADVVDADTVNDYFGVNTSSPSANFQVNQSTLAPGTVSNSAGGTTVTGTSTTFTTTFEVGDTLTVTSTTNTCTIASITDDTHLSCSSALASLSTNSAYTTGNTARFVVQNNGNVGIGTSSPSRTLNVATNNSSTSTPQVLVDQTGSGDSSLQFRTPSKSWTIGASSANSSSLVINSSTAASNATLGNTVGATTDSGDQNIMECTQFTAGGNGTATSISVKMNNAAAASPNNNFSMAVYTGSGTQPTTLVASTTTGTLSTSAGINSLSISFTITNGTIYWLCANNNSTSGSASNWGYDTGGANNGRSITQTFGTWPSTITAGAGTATTQKFAYYVSYTPTGSFTSFATPLFMMTDTGQTTLQNSTDSTSEFNIQNASGVKLFSVGSSNATLTLGAGSGVATASTVNIGVSASATQTVNIGSTTANSASASTAVLIQGGSTATAISIQALASGTISIGSANAANTVQIGSTTLSSGTQVIGIGNNTTSGGTTNITIGTTTSAGGFTTVQAAGALTLKGGAASTWQLTSGTLTIQSAGNVAVSGAAVTLSATATSSFTTTGGNLSITDSGASTNTVSVDETGTGGALNLGNATATININGSGASNNARTINIATGPTSQAQTVTIGNSANTAASTITINAGTNASASVSINGGTQTATTTIGNSAGGNVAVQTSGNFTLTSSAAAIPMLINETSGTTQESAIGYQLGGTLAAEIGSTGTATHIVNQSAINDLGIKSLLGNVWIAAGGSSASIEISKVDGSETIQSTSAAALNVQTSGGVAVFQVNTTNKDIIIGGSTADPTGVAGAMYYNSSTNQFRCYNNNQWENCIGLDSDAFRQQPFYATDFLDNGPLISSNYVDAAAPWTGYPIASGTVTGGVISTQTAGHPGVVRIQSSTSVSSGLRYALNGSGLFMTAGLSYELTFNVATINGTTMRIGFYDTSGTTAPGNGLWISATGSGTTLTINGKTAAAGTTSTTGSSYTSGTAGTWYRAKVVANSANTGVNFYLYNDSGTQLWTDSLSTNLPTTNINEFTPGMMAYSSNASITSLVDLDYMALWWTSSLAR